MTQVQPAIIESVKSESAVPHQQHPAQTPIDRILQKLSRLELPAKEHFESYLRHKWRLNHKPQHARRVPLHQSCSFSTFMESRARETFQRLNGLISKPSSSTSRTEDYISPRCGRGWPA